MAYYRLLNVSPQATEKEIQKAYRRLVKVYHPDRNQHVSQPQRQQREEKLKRINIAYDILSNPFKRRQYDAKRSWQTQSAASRQQRRHTHSHTRQQKKQTSSQEQPYSRAYAEQKLKEARSEYLKYKSRLASHEKFIADRLLHILLKAGLVGVGTSLTAVIMLYGVNLLFTLVGYGRLGLIISVLYLFVIQLGATLLVMQHIDSPLHWKTNPFEAARLGGTTFVSLLLTTSFIRLSGPAGLLIGNVFAVALLSHMGGCVFLSQYWITPLLAKRRRLEERVTSARDILAYYQQTMSYSRYR